MSKFTRAIRQCRTVCGIAHDEPELSDKRRVLKEQSGGWRYDIVGLGLKINMADVNAAIGLAQIRKYDKLLKERKRVFQMYDDAFSKCDWAILPPAKKKEGRETSYHIYALRIKDITEEKRDAMIDEIARKGVAVNVHFIPMPMLSFFKQQGYDIADYPVAYNNYKREISLPIYPQLTDEQVRYVIDAVITAYEKVKIRMIRFLIFFFFSWCGCSFPFISCTSRMDLNLIQKGRYFISNHVWERMMKIFG